VGGQSVAVLQPGVGAPLVVAYAEELIAMDADPHAVFTIVEACEAGDVAHLIGRTWTTDAFYRETCGRVARSAPTAVLCTATVRFTRVVHRAKRPLAMHAVADRRRRSSTSSADVLDAGRVDRAVAERVLGQVLLVVVLGVVVRL